MNNNDMWCHNIIKDITNNAFGCGKFANIQRSKIRVGCSVKHYTNTNSA